MTTTSLPNELSRIIAEAARDNRGATDNDVKVVQAARDIERERNRILVAGAIASGNGYMLGWDGHGKATGAQLNEVRENAGLTTDWNIKTKSDTTYLTRACDRMNLHGYVSRRDKSPKFDKTTGTRPYRERRIIFKADTATAKVGEAVGQVVLTVELHDDSSALHFEGDAGLAQTIQAEYLNMLDNQIYHAADVTAWLSKILTQHCHAVINPGLGYYIPACGHDTAKAVTDALAPVWGTVGALIPVATSEQLLTGLTRGLLGDVRRFEAKIAAERKAALRRGKEDLAPSTAARLLVGLSALNDTAISYGALVGIDNAREVTEFIGRLRAPLELLADDASVRFAMLDLSQPVAAEEPAPSTPTPAERKADAALAARRERPTVDLKPSAVDAAIDAAMPMLDLGFATPIQIDPDPDRDERWGNLELD